MGDRGHVHIEDTGVWLYTHWNASELTETVATAIGYGWRLGQPPYLTRIIFDEMVGDQQGTSTGYGIQTEPQSDVWLVINVNCDKQRITVREGMSLDRDGNELVEGTTTFDGSFGDFVDEFAPDTDTDTDTKPVC